MRSSRIALCVVVCAFTLVALAAPVASATPASGGTLAFQLGSQPPGIDPRYAVYYDSAIVADALFDGLTALDGQTAAVLPAAAASWEASADATVWTFHLRPEAKFSDGTPVTAQDFKASWERLLSPTLQFDFTRVWID
jgi:oligopeptide transport system substrate-binding protein